ncbi:MAG: OadG family transporter subunit [Chloroflexota bacterium]|nr:OadG family transporter subunit [Chloroflexota bacterium]
MDNPIIISLVVSGIGMLLLFLALALLYGLMYLMTALFKDQPTSQQTNKQTNQPANQPANQQHQAAVIAVALARAEMAPSPIGVPETPGAGKPISDWWTLHHQRQLTLNAPTRQTR